MKRLSAFSFLLFFIATSAVAQTNQVVFSFDHKVGSEPLILGQTVFPIWNNKNVVLTRAEFYISEVELLHSDSTKLPLADQYLLVNANTSNAEFDLGAWPAGAVQGITLHLGVPASVNHNDPASYPSNHPLAPQNPTMHWGWSAGYRFMAIEGKVDNNGDGVPETTFEFHNLFDELYRTAEVSGVKSADNGVLHLHFVLDYVQLFKNMAMTGSLIQHGKFANNIAMMNNAATQHFIALTSTSAAPEASAQLLDIKVSPNPANAEAVLEYSTSVSGPLELTITNMLGQQVRQLSGIPASGTLRLETASLPDGIYQCTFYNGNSLFACKQLMVKH